MKPKLFIDNDGKYLQPIQNKMGITDGKDDKNKVDMTYLRQFRRALTAVCQVSEKGAQKYARGSWANVPDAERRYDGALMRHWLWEHGEIDSELNLDHAMMTAWNALATLEKMLERQESVENSLP